MNKDLRDKLFNFETLPPAGLWNKIAHSLDDDKEYSLAERLLQYEAPPPSGSWEGIVELLDRDNHSVVPFRKNYSFLRYAGAAAVLIICASISFLYLSNRQDDRQVTTINEKGSLLQSPPINNPPEKTNSDYNREVVNQQEPANLIPSSHARQGYAIRLHPLPSRKPSSSIKDKLSAKLPSKKPSVSSEHLERYIVFSKTTGEAVRLSKKLFGLFACSERDINCEKNIKSVQQKMASASMMASTDFTGMLEALQTMNKEHNN